MQRRTEENHRLIAYTELTRVNGENVMFHGISYLNFCLISCVGLFEFPKYANPQASGLQSSSMEVDLWSNKGVKADCTPAPVPKTWETGKLDHRIDCAQPGHCRVQPAKWNADTAQDLSQIGCWTEKATTPVEITKSDRAVLADCHYPQQASWQHSLSGGHAVSKRGSDVSRGPRAAERSV